MLKINNEKKHDLTLEFITDKSKSVHSYVIRKNYATTLINSEKRIYMYFDSKKEVSVWDLKDALYSFIVNNEYDLNIDLSTAPIEEKTALHLVVDSILYCSFNSLNYKTTKQQNKAKINYNVITNVQNALDMLKKFEILYKHKNFARDLQDSPPNKMTPEIFANLIEEKAKNISNLKTTILDQKTIEKNKMGLLLAVNAGSSKDARVVILEYKGNPKSKEKTALVGKGITFDTGGISLKPSFAMSGMKYDMSGAAIVCSTLLTLAELKGKQNVIAIACLTENQIGSTATLVESVATSMNGKTVEITNTDAEGRLVVADGITYAIRNLKATKIIEVSTLTGAILIALGDYMTGVFADNEKLYNDFKKAADIALEEVWRMPIHRINVKNMLKSSIADIINASNNRNGGSSNAAAFIQQFTENLPYIHLDIAGTASSLYGSGRNSGTGVMIKTLTKLLLN